MEKCKKCGVNEKAPRANKYCDACKIIAETEADARYRVKHRLNKLKPCEECGVRNTRHKYCYDCKVKVHRRQNRERNQLMRQKARGICTRCETNPKWSSNPTTKYCLECKQIMKSEVLELKNKTLRSDRKERKKPVHKGIINDPDKQKPTVQEPLNSKEGGINPYFLRRKN